MNFKMRQIIRRESLPTRQQIDASIRNSQSTISAVNASSLSAVTPLVLLATEDGVAGNGRAKGAGPRTEGG